MSRDLDRIADMAAHGALDRHRACTGKAAYPTRGEARNGAKQCFQRSGRHALIYRCPFDGTHYHITKLKHGEAMPNERACEDDAA